MKTRETLGIRFRLHASSCSHIVHPPEVHEICGDNVARLFGVLAGMQCRRAVFDRTAKEHAEASRDGDDQTSNWSECPGRFKTPGQGLPRLTIANRPASHARTSYWRLPKRRVDSCGTCNGLPSPPIPTLAEECRACSAVPDRASWGTKKVLGLHLAPLRQAAIVFSSPQPSPSLLKASPTVRKTAWTV